MFIKTAHNFDWDISSPQIMGILNITPDSFFDESRHDSVEAALRKAEQLIKEGASILDIGGQSTRPQAEMIHISTELARVLPVIQAIRNSYPNQLISIDTFNSQVAAAAINAGANIINDISCGSFDSNMFEVAAASKAGYIGMHITGKVETMHIIENRNDIIQDILAFFRQKKQQLAKVGITNWVLDPGFGFGKSIDENFTIVKRLNELAILELPILLGVSRKSSIYKTLGIQPGEALNGTTILNTLGMLHGASILRVHDVKEAAEILTLLPFIKP